MAATGLSLLNVFVLGLVQRRRERAVLRAIGARPRQEQAVVIAHAVLLGAPAAVFGGLGGIGLSYLWALGSPVQYGICHSERELPPCIRSSRPGGWNLLRCDLAHDCARRAFSSPTRAWAELQ